MAPIDIVGISGKAGSGKDYISQTILRPMGYYQWSFAWHFKISIVGKGLATHDEVFITKPEHVRKELQLEGTERGRNIYGEDIWCKTAAEWLTVLHETWGIDKFVVPDVRFPNEVEFIRNMGGRVIRLNAPKRVADSSLSAEARLHISETALDDYPLENYHAVVNNDYEYAPMVRSQIIQALN